MDIILAIFLLLLFALILGELFEKFNLPSIVGEILAGVILGPAFLNFIKPGPILSGISEIALFFIVLLIGIELTTESLRKHYKTGVLFTMTSFVIPVIAMILISIFLLHLSEETATILSVAIGVPSISIISVLVMRYDLLGTEDGARIVSSVVLTDVIAFMVLAAIGVSSVPIYIVIISVLAFILVLLAIDRMIRYHAAFIRKRLISKYRTRGGEELIFAGIILMGLIGSAVLQIAGITYVLGAFFVGLLIHDAIVGKRIYGILKRTFSRITNSFFIPIFFSIAGLQVVRPSDYLWLMVVLIIVSGSIGGILSYLAGSKLLKKLRPVTAVALLGSRGAVGIIIANIALLQGDINTDLYSIIILGTVILSLVLPALMGGEDSAMRRRSR